MTNQQDFQQTLNQTIANRKALVEQRITDMMSKLDYTKHDNRNNRRFVERTLCTYYNSCLDSTISPVQWDEMFAIYTPYNGTY